MYWMARKAGFAATYGKMPTVLSEDVTVPRGNIPAHTKKVKEIGKKYNVENCILGHAEDGNLHPSVLTDVKNKEHYDRAMKAVDEIIEGGGGIGWCPFRRTRNRVGKEEVLQPCYRSRRGEHDEGRQGSL